MTIFIVEGVDGVGKTEYTEALAKQLECLRIHAGPPTEHSWGKEYVNPLHAGQTVVLDRWHVGEMVWPKYFGRQSLFETSQQFNLCNFALSLLGAKLMLIYRDAAGIKETLTERGEMKQYDTVMRAQDDYMKIVTGMKHIPVVITHSDVIHRDVTCSSK